MGNKSINTFLIFALLFIGCAGPSSGSTEQRESRDLPDWAIEQPVSDNVIYAVSQAKKQNPSLATKIATGRARSEISQVVATKVATLLNDFMQESGVGENAQAAEFSENITKQVSNNVLNGSKVIKTYPSKDGTVFVLLEYSLDMARQEALQSVKKEEALFNELKAREGLQALEDAIRNMR